MTFKAFCDFLDLHPSHLIYLYIFFKPQSYSELRLMCAVDIPFWNTGRKDMTWCRSHGLERPSLVPVYERASFLHWFSRPKQRNCWFCLSTSAGSVVFFFPGVEWKLKAMSLCMVKKQKQ